MTTPTRSVSELIEVWQDWTLDIQLKKRRRAWTMDDTNIQRASSPGGGNWNTDPMNFRGFQIGSSGDGDGGGGGKRNGRRRKKRERHSYDKVIRHCVSFPEDSLMRDSASVGDENENVPNLDLSAIQDISMDMNTTSLSMDEAVNDSVFHIGCIDSDGNPLNDVSDVESDQVETSHDTVKRTSSDEMDYSSIEKVNKVTNPLEVADVFGDVSMLQHDECLQINDASGDHLDLIATTPTKDIGMSVEVPLQHQRIETETDEDDVTHAENAPFEFSGDMDSSQDLYCSTATQNITSPIINQASIDENANLYQTDLDSERSSTHSSETSLDSLPQLNESTLSRQDDHANSPAIKDVIIEQQQHQTENADQSVSCSVSNEEAHGSLDATTMQNNTSNYVSFDDNGAIANEHAEVAQDGDENIDPQSADKQQNHDTPVLSKNDKLESSGDNANSLATKDAIIEQQQHQAENADQSVPCSVLNEEAHGSFDATIMQNNASNYVSSDDNGAIANKQAEVAQDEDENIDPQSADKQQNHDAPVSSKNDKLESSEIGDNANSLAIKDVIIEQQQHQAENADQSVLCSVSNEETQGSFDATAMQNNMTHHVSSDDNGAIANKQAEVAQDEDENIDPQSADKQQNHDAPVSLKNDKSESSVTFSSSLESNARAEKQIVEVLTSDESTMHANLLSVTFRDEPTDSITESSHTPIEPVHQSIDNPSTSALDCEEGNPLHSGEPRVKKERDHSSRKKRERRRRYQVANVEQDAAIAFSPHSEISQVSVDRSCAKSGDYSKTKTELQSTSVDLIESSILYSTDPILGKYTEKVNLATEFYTKTQPYRIGDRNLPSNQIEVVLRRRAIKKREAAKAAATSSCASVGERSTQSSKSSTSTAVATGRGPKTPPMHHNVPRPPSRENQSVSTRRTLFPNLPGHSRSHSLGMDTTFEDDSTISSATVASTWTAGNSSIAISLSNAPQSTDSPDIQQMPQEEIVGDTSLGLKLTILNGKVIVQAISPLEDGRASPAQLCGLFHPGDILIAVNDSFLINNGNIHSPVPMDKMVEALKPLSEAIEGNGRYSREVRLRFVVGEGRKLLQEQKEREEKKQRIIQERKKLGLDGKAGAASIDHAADIFGLSALMGVDQHTGMPMFQDHHLETHYDESVNEITQDEAFLDETVATTGVGDGLTASDDTSLKHPNDNHSLFTKTPLTIQSRISNQVAKERQWMRDRNSSGFFALDSRACVLLRAPSPPTIDKSVEKQYPKLNPIEVRQKRLELGTSNISHAKELVSKIEQQERGVDIHDDEDPLEVASRICGTTSVRTGASRRRWHRGDSFIKEESTVVSASSMENQADTNTVEAEESVEMCDHQMLVDLAANHQSWKRNVIKRLEDYATDTEKAIRNESINKQNTSVTKNGAPPSLDSLLFGSDVAKMLEKKKNSLALPPGEMTQMLFDLKEHLNGGLPGHIFTNHGSFTAGGQEKSITFLRSPNESNEDISKATDYLLNEALDIWLKCFRPLPWKQRRALWPTHLPGSYNESSSMVSSHFDDGMSLSMASGGTQTTTKTEKRNLREMIEELELDPETRRETCNLVTFYFVHKCLHNGHTELSNEDEKTALEFVDVFGAYLDLHKTLVIAGNIESQSLAQKLVSLAKFDPQHREAMKGLQKAKVLLFYEPNMLSALHELLQTGAYNTMSENVDVTRLLVSSYPDLSPTSVKNASAEDLNDFYFNYLSLLMHPDEGSDAAKDNARLVREWCSLLCASIESNDEKSEDSMLSFHRVASASEDFSSMYTRDLPFLLEMSIKISEYTLALDIAREMVTCPSSMQNLILNDVVKHLRYISRISIEGELDSQLLGEVIAFYTDLSFKSSQEIDGFDIINELTNIVQQCIGKRETDSSCVKSTDINVCLSLLSENTTPSDGLKVLSQLELSGVDQSARVSALHTLLTRGASESVDKEISASLLRIQRVREEKQHFDFEEGMSVYNFDENGAEVDEDESNGFIWPNILDGRMIISK